MKTRHSSESRKAFTILELMIVIGVLAILMAILIPALSYVKTQAKKASTVALLNSIGLGLEQYHSDHNMYPPSNPKDPVTGNYVYNLPSGPLNRGGLMLTEGLTGYLNADHDGAGPPLAGDPSLGFRTRRQTGTTLIGKIYGPYIQTGGSTWKVITDDRQVVIDPWGNEILYFRAGPQIVNGKRRDIKRIFQDPSNPLPAYFLSDDNPGAYKQTSVSSKNPTGEVAFGRAESPSNPDFLNLLGGSMPGENILGINSYLLISAGPDNTYFTGDDIIHAGK